MRDVKPYDDSFMYIEVWGFLEEKGKPEVIGWTIMNLFDKELRLLIGRYRIPLYSPMMNPQLLFK